MLTLCVCVCKFGCIYEIYVCVNHLIGIKNEESQGWDEWNLDFSHKRPFSDSHKTAGFHTQQHR